MTEQTAPIYSGLVAEGFDPEQVSPRLDLGALIAASYGRTTGVEDGVS